MKKMIVLVSMMVVSLSFFAGCDSKGKKCAKLFDKMTTCTKELGEGGKMMASKLDSKDKFVSECKKEFDKVKKMADCADKSPCGAFWTCALGEEAAKAMTNMAMAPDMPAEVPAVDMPAPTPATDMPAEVPAADMPAEAPAADMPAEAPAADMPADM